MGAEDVSVCFDVDLTAETPAKSFRVLMYDHKLLRFNVQLITCKGIDRPGLVLVHAVLFANYNIFVGGVCDAYMFSEGVPSMLLDTPTLHEANDITFILSRMTNQDIHALFTVRGWGVRS